MGKIYSVTDTNPMGALQKAMNLYGENAKVLTTKQIRAKSINQDPLYEILVSVEEQKSQKQQEKIINFQKNIEQKTQKDYVKEQDNISLDISKVAKEISAIATDTKENNKIDEKFQQVVKEVNIMGERLNLISDMLWKQGANERDNLTIPPEFASIYKAAKSSGMKQEHLNAIMNTTLAQMPAYMKSNPTAVKRYFYSLLRNMLPCRLPSEHKRQEIMMLVGPTGVGKTTTLAKLAAKFAYGDKRFKTGIITLDTYRIGAVEQLFQYAKMMKLPIIDVMEVGEFKSALNSLNYCDVILIDTTGGSQYDKEKLDKLGQYLKHSGAKIDVSLVLTAGTKIEDLQDSYQAFSFLDIDTLIITKFDETKIFGNVFSLIYDTSTPVSFFCVGQEVPDDLMDASSEFLVSCVLDGFSKVKK